ncbi:hypothetical protein [Actinoplanes sp. NPDC026623]|uniref:hypothetical protein n=1 Tax=Actinoplanes sp. NPDC026623 TaxID=3155610 RepID=UPI0033DB9D7C
MTAGRQGEKWTVVVLREIFNGVRRFGWSDQYQALQVDADRRRAPQRLLTRAIRGYIDGVVSAQTIATLRGIAPDTAAAELREAGIFPARHPVSWADPAELPEVQVDLDAVSARRRQPGGGWRRRGSRSCPTI